MASRAGEGAYPPPGPPKPAQPAGKSAGARASGRGAGQGAGRRANRRTGRAPARGGQKEKPDGGDGPKGPEPRPANRGRTTRAQRARDGRPREKREDGPWPADRTERGPVSGPSDQSEDRFGPSGTHSNHEKKKSDNERQINRMSTVSS